MRSMKEVVVVKVCVNIELSVTIPKFLIIAVEEPTELSRVDAKVNNEMHVEIRVNPIFYPQKRAEFEILKFIEVWGEGYEKLRMSVKKFKVFKSLSRTLFQKHGVDLSPEKFQNRVKSFTKRYR